MIGYGREHDGLYRLVEGPLKGQVVLGESKSTHLQIIQWHKRLGHPSFYVLAKLYPHLFKHCNVETLVCDAYKLTKHTRISYPPINNKSSVPFMMIHSDVWGPSPVVSVSGYKWFVTFIDCYSRMTWVYLMHAKNEVFSCFQSFHKMISTQFDAKIKILRTDNGTEYMEKTFHSYLDNHGITHQTSCVYTAAQNGVSEHKNRHLLEVTRALMFAMNVPKVYWGDTVLTAAYLINRMPLRTLDFKYPIELIQGS